MKKILMVLLLSILLLPMVVKADAFKPSIYYDHDVKVGDTVDEYILFYTMNIGEFEVDYDSQYLSITKDNIKIIYEGNNLLNNSEFATVEITNGKILFNIKKLPEPEHVVDGDLARDSIYNSIELSFIALKEGETKITTPSMYERENFPYYGTSASITITKKDQPVEPPKEPDETEGQEKPVDPPKGDKNKDLAFYGSLLVNVLQLIAIIILVVVGKKRSKAKQEPKIEVVEEPKEEIEKTK